MANMNLVIPDAQVPRVINALCAGVVSNDPANIPPPQPSAALAKQVLIDFIKSKVKSYEEDQARQAIPPVDVSTIVS